MTYATIMVHLELGCSNVGVLHAARDLAARFDARVFGITACQPFQVLSYDTCYVSNELIEQDRAQNEADNAAAKLEFRNVFPSRADVMEWRSALTLEPLAMYLAAEARRADIVVTTVMSASVPNRSRRVATSDVVMQVGRPVLVVPAGMKEQMLQRVVIAWKDTREARRATMDALPLLRKVGHVDIVAVVEEDEMAASEVHLRDVAGWLKRHDVTATASTHRSTGNDSAQLKTITRELKADVVVAGAYGHNRPREWAFGGVTRDFLLQSQCCALVSH